MRDLLIVIAVCWLTGAVVGGVVVSYFAASVGRTLFDDDYAAIVFWPFALLVMAAIAVVRAPFHIGKYLGRRALNRRLSRSPYRHLGGD